MGKEHLMNIKDKALFITGGTGTFGNAVVERTPPTAFGEIRIFSRDEKKQDDMRRRWADPRVKFHIGDVRDEQSLKDAMAGVDLVFHAAALKQVPSCEFFPIEAVRTDVLGVENVLIAAIAEGVKKVIVLSNYKAVYPIRAIGVSKMMRRS
jgi:UDP-glucose 4-epimerase